MHAVWSRSPHNVLHSPSLLQVQEDGNQWLPNYFFLLLATIACSFEQHGRHMACALIGMRFRGQTTAEIVSLLEHHNIVSVQIPPNCMDKLQPMDISVNKPMKDELKISFQTWYASKVSKQIEEVPVDKVKDSNSHQSKEHYLDHLCSRQAVAKWPEIAISGFRRAGIVAALSFARD